MPRRRRSPCSIRPIRTATTKRPRSRCYDSLGATHTAHDCTSTRPRTPNQWTTHLYVDGTRSAARRRCTYSNTGALRRRPAAVAFPAYTPTTGAAPMNDDCRLRAVDAVRQHLHVNAADAGRFHHRPPHRHRHRLRPASCRRASPTAGRTRSARSRSPTSRTRRACSSSATRPGPRPSRRARRCAARPATRASA